MSATVAEIFDGGEVPSPKTLRHVFGHFATGVTVVSAITAGSPVGIVCNSFASASLEPPLVSLAVARTSETWPQMRAGGSIGISFLAAHQHRLGRAFAAKGADRFADVPWRPSPFGNPLVDDSLAWLDCTLEQIHDAGDHELVLARVRWLDSAEGEPLVFFRGLFARLGEDPAAPANDDAPVL